MSERFDPLLALVVALAVAVGASVAARIAFGVNVLASDPRGVYRTVTGAPTAERWGSWVCRPMWRIVDGDAVDPSPLMVRTLGTFVEADPDFQVATTFERATGRRRYRSTDRSQKRIAERVGSGPVNSYRKIKLGQSRARSSRLYERNALARH